MDIRAIETITLLLNYYITIVKYLMNGSFELSDHVAQNRQTGEQMMHWDVLNNENLVT